MRMNGRIGRMAVLVAAMLVAFAGCGGGQAVQLEYNDYTPDLANVPDLGAYEGTMVYLENFQKTDQDTTLWSYYDPETGTSYSTYSLTGYFWYVFQTALNRAGVVVSSGQVHDPKVPRVSVTMQTINADEYTFRVKVQKMAASVLDKTYTITAPEPSEDAAVQRLEQRAYEMANEMAVKMLSDPEFRKALTS
ncbi:MAG: hypothetical protein ACLFOY_14430 [Desulfatibacillaceae bacterium]